MPQPCRSRARAVPQPCRARHLRRRAACLEAGAPRHVRRTRTRLGRAARTAYRACCVRTAYRVAHLRSAARPGAHRVTWTSPHVSWLSPHRSAARAGAHRDAQPDAQAHSGATAPALILPSTLENPNPKPSPNLNPNPSPYPNPNLLQAQLLAGLEASPGFVTVKRHLRVRQTWSARWRRRPLWSASQHTSAYWPRLAEAGRAGGRPELDLAPAGRIKAGGLSLAEAYFGRLVSHSSPNRSCLPHTGSEGSTSSHPCWAAATRTACTRRAPSLVRAWGRVAVRLAAIAHCLHQARTDSDTRL